MGDFMKQLRDQALEKEKDRKKADSESLEDDRNNSDAVKSRELADFLGVTPEVADACCGSICPHCDLFLDKAIALEQLGYPHHLFMNPTQEEVYKEAKEIFEKDRKEYDTQKKELIERMKGQGA
ncbi:hypothetical protein MNBD_NITROSPINAE04-1206 [hydrothermal vent metagenome]|uniref:Uncharacterized protein n=1 Tax=hydrothermal vent metagenome TaxID=652676 RepID=A0A3B1BZN4_9ZZZZ